MESPLSSTIPAVGGKIKRRLASAERGAGLFLAAALLLAPALPAREVAVTILHTSDLHGHVAAVASDRGKELGGGLLRCATLIARIRAQDPNVLLIDCGDLLQGSPESYVTGGRIIVEAVRQLRYSALVTGNHEFDGGVDALRRFYDQVRIPVLAANIGSRQEPAWPGARPFLCQDMEGVRVAIVGLSNPLIPLWSRPCLLGDITVEGSRAALRRVMPLVRACKPDILVLAAHQGRREWGDDPANEIHAIAQAFPDFDVILGAHTHQAVEWKTVNGVAYTQAGCYGLWLGAVRLVFDTEARRITSKRIRLLAVDSAVPPESALQDRVSPALKETEQYLRQEVGAAAAELKPTSRVRGQSAIQTLIARSIAERVQADVVIHRALTEEALGAGRITMRDVWRIVPFDNYIGVARLTLDEIRQILEENSLFFDSREFRGIYGLTYDLKPGAAPGARVSNIRLTGKRSTDDGHRTADDRPKQTDNRRRPAEGGDWVPETERIRVAFNSYDMASAGGRLPRLRALLAQSSSRLEEHLDADTRDAVREYLGRHQPLDIQAAPGAHIVPK